MTSAGPTEALLGSPVLARFHQPMTVDEFRQVMRTIALGRRHDAVLVVRSSAGRVAVIRKPSYPIGGWRIPGGGVEADETLIEGARRELREECGIDAEPCRYLLRATLTFDVEGAPLRWTTHVLLADVDDEPPLSGGHAGEDIAERAWIDSPTLRAANELFRSTSSAALRYRGDVQDAIQDLLSATPRCQPSRKCTA